MKFDTVDYTNWIQKIKKELKLEALDEKHLTLFDGQNFNPFFERKQYHSFESTRSKHHWLIGEIIDLENTSNSDILSMLEGGAQKLLLINALKNTDFEKLLKDVYLSMVQIHLETEIHEIADQFISYIYKHVDEESRKFHSCNLAKINHGLKSTIEIDASDPNTLKEFCRKSVAFITLYEKEAWSSIVENLRIAIVVQNKGIEHIAVVDAVKTLWSLICRSYGEEEILPQIEQIVTFNRDLSMDENFISSTVQAVNAVIATGDTLYVQNSPDNSGFSRRINRNIQHLLQLESFMHQSAAAYQGSYVIEKMSNMLVNDTWNQFKV